MRTNSNISVVLPLRTSFCTKWASASGSCKYCSSFFRLSHSLTDTDGSRLPILSKLGAATTLFLFSDCFLSANGGRLVWLHSFAPGPFLCNACTLGNRAEVELDRRAILENAKSLRGARVYVSGWRRIRRDSLAGVSSGASHRRQHARQVIIGGSCEKSWWTFCCIHAPTRKSYGPCR